jgi:30S ribosomal protein S31
MGKGDKRTRRGKIFAGSYGNVRPKKEVPATTATAAARPAARTARKKA